MDEDRLVTDGSPVEFFREQLSKAMEHQKVSTSAFTEYYLVNLLAGAVRAETLAPSEAGFFETPLALLYIRALHTERAERTRLLRLMGDTALFMSGFFCESLQTRLANLDYYRTMGRRAYGRLSQETHTAFGLEVFDELAQRFTAFADVLSEVSELSRLTTNHSVVRLYERWLQTGSVRAASLLAARGIAPAPGDDEVH